jgi:5-methylcytosine-specific restriction endonuclease McrA
VRASSCHPELKHYALGLCFKCYNREQATKWRRAHGSRPIQAQAPSCHPEQKYFAKGLCQRCYESERSKKRRRPPRQRKVLTEEQRKEKLREYSRRHEEKRRGCPKRKAANKQWRQDNAELLKAWRDSRREIIRAQTRKYERARRAAGGDKRRRLETIEHTRLRERLKAHNRRERARNNPGSSGVKPKQWLQILEQFENRCAYCGAPAEEIDHVIPLSKGGAHSPSNVVPACSPCNGSKHDKLLLDWVLAGGPPNWRKVA